MKPSRTLIALALAGVATISSVGIATASSAPKSVNACADSKGNLSLLVKGKCAIHTSKVSIGPQGIQGKQGIQGIPGISIKGDKGDQGQMGQMGQQGNPGLPELPTLYVDALQHSDLDTIGTYTAATTTGTLASYPTIVNSVTGLPAGTYLVNEVAEFLGDDDNVYCVTVPHSGSGGSGGGVTHEEDDRGGVFELSDVETISLPSGGSIDFACGSSDGGATFPGNGSLSGAGPKSTRQGDGGQTLTAIPLGSKVSS